jgi:hypothetical protein
MKDQADYSKYECPYSHIQKDCGHELHGPEGYENTYGVWCACGFRGPVFCLDPVELHLLGPNVGRPCEDCEGTGWYGDNGPGIIGNSEFVRCECGTGEKCRIGSHHYIVIGGVAWCEKCNREADMDICRIHHVLPNAVNDASAVCR